MKGDTAFCEDSARVHGFVARTRCYLYGWDCQNAPPLSAEERRAAEELKQWAIDAAKRELGE
jgi:hypothetical protein